MKNIVVLGSLAALLATTALSAQVAVAADAKPRTAESLACSKEADAKGLHGKARKSFRKACVKKSAPAKPGKT